MTDETATQLTPDQQLHDEAARSLKKKRDFRTHLFTYVWVNALLVVIWAVTGATSSGPYSRLPVGAWGSR
jgi:hypothetical protein